MRASHRTRARKKRRQDNAAIKHGKKAKPKHKAKTGRTGQIIEKKNHSKKNSGYSKSYRFKFPGFEEIQPQTRSER